MDNYDVFYEDGEKICTVEASSCEEAFVKGVGSGYTHREVSKDDFYDIVVRGKEGDKYFWIRFG